MIVPRARLLWWFGLIVAPAIAIIPLAPEPGILIATGCVAVWVLDAALTRPSVHVTTPDVVRLTRKRASQVDVTVIAPSVKRLRIGFALPASAFPDALPIEVRTLGRLAWPCMPIQRGVWNLSDCWIETASRWGFWDIRWALPVATEIRVYPNLASEHRKLAALTAAHGGMHTRRQVGRGREFEKLREYVPGDSLDEIHWKATARHAIPITKVFQIERTQEVYAVIDASRLSGRVHDGDAVLEGYITAGLLLGDSAQRHGDLFGLLTFSDQVHKFVRAGNGREHYGACRDAVLKLQTRLVVPDYRELITFVRLHLRRRALLIIMTALDDAAAAESLLECIGLIAATHLVQVVTIEPAGAQPLFSGATVETTDQIYDRLAGHLLWKNLRDTGKALERRGVRFASVTPDRLSLALTTNYLEVKRRQLL